MKTAGLMILCLALCLALSGFTGTLEKNDGSAWEGITVEVVSFHTGSVLSTAVTDSDGEYIVNLPQSGYVRLQFKTSSGTVVRPAIPIHIDSIRGVVDSVAPYTLAELDSIMAKEDFSAVPAGRVWGHTIKSQAEMVPYLSIRFDDIGNGNAEAWIDKVTTAMDYGVIPSLAVNWGNIDNAADSSVVRAIAIKAEETGIRPDWMIHANYNMSPDAHGNTPVMNTWEDYYLWERDDWVAELDPQPLRDLINGLAEEEGISYRVTTEDVVGWVWPGDSGPYRKAMGKRARFFIAEVMEEVGLEYMATAIGAQDSSRSWAAGHVVNLAPIQSTDLMPFVFSGGKVDKTFMPMPFSTDLGNKVIERGATDKVPWAPSTTQEWALAKNTNYCSVCPPTAYTESTVSNFNKTIRADYLWALARGSSLSWTAHPRDDYSITYSFPQPGSLNDDLEIGDSVNGGASTFTDPFDYEYMYAVAKQLIDKGYFRAGSYTQMVRWLASSPGKPGLRVAGFTDPQNPAVEIGDTVGVVPMPILQGSGTNGFATSYPPLSSRFIRGTLLGDDDFDGKSDMYGQGQSTTWDDVTDPDVGWYLAANQGDVNDDNSLAGDNNALMLWDHAGLNATIDFQWSMLPPGEYVATVTTQSVQRIDHLSNVPQLWMTGTAEMNRAASSYGLPDYTLVTVLEANLGDAADEFLVHEVTAGPNAKLGATNFGDDVWPGGEPLTRDGAWYQYNISFTVPSSPRSSNFDPLTNIEHGRAINWKGHLYLPLGFFGEDVSGGYGQEEHPRIGSVQLFWMGKE